jgi:hypothetical protein
MKQCLLSMFLAGIFSVITWPFSASAADQSEAPGSRVVEQEARTFVNRIQSGEIAALSNDDVVKTFKALNPEIIASYLEIGAQPYNEYELWMRREERLGGHWPAKPFLNYIKYRQQPRQVYVKWLDGGAKAGQEMIFDETRRKDAMYGHIGGFFNVMSIWTALDGVMARDNSNHTVADLGVKSIFAIVTTERAQYQAEGHRPYPDRIEIADAAGQRTVALTWIAPSPKHYAYRTKVYLELAHPMVRGIEAWDDHGTLIERIFLERIVPANFKEADFDPGNKAYAF